MNAEQQRQFEEIKINFPGYDMNRSMSRTDFYWLITRLEAEAQDNERLDRLLQSLTPGGSEFVHDPERCVRFVQQARTGELQALKNAVVLRQAAEARAAALEAENGRLRKALESQCAPLGGIALVLRGQGSPELSEELRGIVDKLREAALAPQAGDAGAQGREKRQWGTTADVWGY